MNFDDYESLPTTSITTNMTAGAIAGILEHCVMYPLDSVKTRMQSLSPVTSGYNITSTFLNMIKNEGIFRPIRGVTAVVAGAGPAHALYFGTYELTKEFLASFTKHNQINYLTSAVCATLLHDAVSNPTEVIKQRMQMYNSPYKTVIGCLSGVYRTEGIKAFYRSYSTQLVMNLPHQSIHFMTYEFFQNLLNVDRKYNPPVHVVAGGAAGAAASALTTPLDVVKTLLNTQEAGYTRGMGAAVRQIYHVAGPRGFFKGMSARVLYSMPATAICWSTYEFFKFYLCGLSRDQYKSSITGKSALQPKDGKSKVTKTSATASATDYINSSANLDVPIDDDRYVLPQTNVDHTNTTETNNDSDITKRELPPSITAPVSPMKTVCELSTNVTNPTLNLNTRHSDVKRPFDRIH